MDQNTYRQELDEVRYTEAGRTALVEQLMAAQAAEQPARRKGWGRKGVVMVLAAVLLVTAAAVATAAPVWLAYFGGLDEQQQAVVENMETTESGLPPAAESEGVTIAPLSILGSKNQLYIMLEIRAPEGTVFTEDGGYHLHSTVKPKVKPTGMAVHSGRFTVLDAGTKEPNVLTCVDEISASYDLGGGTYCISGLDGRETSEWIFEGEWNFPLPEDLTGNQVLEPEAAGVTVETEQGTFTLDSISVSPLGIWWQYRFDGTNEPVIYAALKMRDGSYVEAGPGQMIVGHPGGSEVATASFAKPVDLNRAVSIYFGNVEIPLDGQGEITAVESVPAIRDEPPFYDQPAGREETGEDESAAPPEKGADTGADSVPASSADRSDLGSETALRHTDTRLVITAKPGGDGMLTASQQREDYYLRTLSLSDCEMIHNEPVTDQFVYKRDVYGDLCFGIDDLTFAEDGYARAAYWSYNDETFVLAVYKDENGDTWGRAFRVPEELVWSGD